MTAFVRNPQYVRDIAARLNAHRLPPQHFADAPIAEGSDTPNWVTTEPPTLHVAAPEIVAPLVPEWQRRQDIASDPSLSKAQREAALAADAQMEREHMRAIASDTSLSDVQKAAARHGQEIPPAVIEPSGPPSLDESMRGLTYQQKILVSQDPSKLDEIVRQNQTGAAQATDRLTLNQRAYEQKKAAAEAESSKSAPVSAPPAADHGAASDTLPRQSAGTYVPAHEVPRVSQPRQEANEQTYAAEAAAEGGAAEAEAKGHENAAQAMRDAAEAQQADLEQSKGERAARAELTSRMLRDAEKAASDVASQKIDPNRFWKNTSTGDRIRYAIAAALGGFAGDHTATNMIQSMIQQDIDAQKSDIENQRTGANAKMTHYNAALQAYGSMDAADEHDRAAKLMYAQMQVKALAEESQAPIVRERAHALEAQLARKAVDAGIAFNPLVPGQMVAGAGAGLSGTPLEVTGQADTVTLQDGREVYIPKGGEDVKKAVRNQQIAIEAAQNLSKTLKTPPPITSPREYNAWLGEVALYTKQAAIAEAGAHGAGGRALGVLRAEASALDQQQKSGGSAPSVIHQWLQMKTGRLESLQRNADIFANTGHKDLDDIIKSSGAYVGHSTIIPGKKPGEPGKPGFIATSRYKPAYDDEKKEQSAVPQMHSIPVPKAGQ